MSSRFIYLSHVLSEATPLYGGKRNIEIQPERLMRGGDSCNTLTVKIPNHASTHIDFPRHFSDSGKSVSDYDPAFWMFRHVWLLDRSAAANEILDLRESMDSIPRETDLLLIRTGFQRFRQETLYWEQNPGLAPECAGASRERCPNLRAVGMDMISVSSFANRELGRAAHRSFLIEQELLLIEDMNLQQASRDISKVYAFPILIQNADGVPATAIGEIDF